MVAECAPAGAYKAANCNCKLDATIVDSMFQIRACRCRVNLLQISRIMVNAVIICCLVNICTSIVKIMTRRNDSRKLENELNKPTLLN